MYSFEKNWSVRDEDEIWKQCTYPDVANEYEVSSYGNIRNIKTGRTLTPYELKRNNKYENVYYIIKLKMTSGKYKNFRVNRLIAWEFCDGPNNNKPVVGHLNDNKFDNYYKNLKYMTHGENTRDALEKGRIKIYGENNPSNIYSEELIRFICKLMEDGKSNTDIIHIIQGKNIVASQSKLYALVNHIRAKDRFTNIAITYNYKPSIKLSSRQHHILSLIKEGFENIDIMRLYGYESISSYSPLYCDILKCRKILYILENDPNADKDIV